MSAPDAYSADVSYPRPVATRTPERPDWRVVRPHGVPLTSGLAAEDSSRIGLDWVVRAQDGEAAQ